MAAIKNSSAIIEAVMAEFPEITAEQVVRLTAAIEGSYAPMVEAVNAAEPEELAVEEELFDEEKATPTQKTAAEFAQIVARFARQELKSAAIKPFKGYGKRATNDPAWLGMSTEGYVFAALVYWLFCFAMSRYSLRLERQLDTGHKH